ncbi:MAG: hypothetical protein IJR98_05495, partial [Synergistaceae bacterium]|nr:hypothetical protein [Synergistaceae bacterium]
EDAEKFRARIAGGESWDVVASGDSAGAINITNSPVMLPESALKTGTLSVLDSIDVGTVSPVFEVASGDYAVALKASHVESGTTPYAEVSEDIRVLLTQQEERNRLAAYEESLMNKAVVVINDNELFASPAEPQNDEQSGDILPVMNVETETKTETKDEPSAASEDAAEKVIAVVEKVSEDTPVVVIEEVSEDEPEEVEAAVVEVSEDEPAEAVAVVEEEEEPESEDVPEEVAVLEVVEISEDEPVEAAAPSDSESEDAEPVTTETVTEVIETETSPDISSEDTQKQ